MSGRQAFPGKFVWFEHVSREPRRAQAFYGEVLGWATRAFPVADASYEMIFAGEKMLGDYTTPADSGAPAHWVSFVSVEDIEATVKSAVENGGRVLVEPHEIPDVGMRALIADPQGAVLSLLSRYADDPPDAYAKQGEFFWNELQTTDPEKAVAFYEQVIGFTHESMDAPHGEKYHALSLGGVGRAGVTRRHDKGAAPHWRPYVYVDDPDQTIARARKLGAEIVIEPTDIPGIGRFGVLEDPTGAVLAVMKPLPMRKPD